MPDVVTAGGPTVAVRVPNHPVALRDLFARGRRADRRAQREPLGPTLADGAARVAADLDGRIDLILDGGPTPAGIESTVLDLSRTPGAAAAAGAGHAGRGRGGDRADPAAGGSRPTATDAAVAGHADAALCAEDAAGVRRRGIPGRGWSSSPARGCVCTCSASAPADVPDFPRDLSVGSLTTPNDAAWFAANLYALLHEVDGYADRILVPLPPDTEEWQAIRDRLRGGGAKVRRR